MVDLAHCHLPACVQGDLLFITPLQKLSDVCMFLDIAVVDKDVINNVAESSKGHEGLIRPAVVMFGYGRYAVKCPKEFVPPKRGDECDKELTVLIQWVLVVSLHCIHLREDFCIVSRDVSIGLSWSCGLVTLTTNILIQM